MKLKQLLGLRFKETPAECQITSHILMLRGGYIKNVGNGIFSLFTPAKRITQKIEAIIRDEMNKIGGQEVMLPISMPASLWEESGRLNSVGSELLRFKDRSGSEMVLGMTHEEVVVHLARDAAQSYTDYPFMVYQIQTKFRDEPRARGGLIRVREFTMKDAYSFHTSQDDLEQYYMQCHEAYERIFARTGIPEIVSVQSDSGMMGGKIAHEFMYLTDVGEDTVVTCDSCDFRSNIEVAECIVKNDSSAGDEPLECVSTPDTKTIDDITNLFAITPQVTCKSVLYRKNETNELVVVFIRGDLEVNETKVSNFLKEKIHPDTSNNVDGIAYGFVGPIDFGAKATVLFDRSLEGTKGLICGANKTDFHFKGFTPERDLQNKPDYHDFATAFEGAICPVCQKESINICRGIEVGNIFQLGTKYSESMGMTYNDSEGALLNPIMGCYGIGVGRLAASVCEMHHDEYGPIWPMSIAPWQVHICALRADDPGVSETASALYDELLKANVEVIFDDRLVSAGVMFSDADLLGVPVRVIISPKTCGRGVVEIAARDKSFKEDVVPSDALGYLKEVIERELGKLNKI